MPIEPPFLPRHYTLAEYFELEARSEICHEYFGGKLYPREGISQAHNTVALNLATELHGVLRDTGCRVFTSSVQVVVKEDFHYVYPDVLVSCDAEDRRDKYQVRKPLLVAEVQSETTAEYDQADKFKAYRQLPSLRYYLLIAENRQCVQLFRRTEADKWVIDILLAPDEVVEIESLQLRLTLAELYADTDIEPRRRTPSTYEPR